MKVPGKVCVALKISFYADAFNQRYQTKQHPLPDKTTTFEKNVKP